MMLRFGRLKISMGRVAPLLVLLLFVGPLRIISTPQASAQMPEPELCISGLDENNNFFPGNPDITRIVQNCFLRDRGFRTLEAQALDALLELHQLPAADRDRLFGWERDAVRAILFTKLMDMILKDPAQRTTSEQAIVDYMAELVKQRRVEAAQYSKDQYIQWTLNPCGYVAPYGFHYPIDHAFCSTFMGGLFDGATPPSFEDFVNYGNAHIYQDFKAGGAAYAISAETARMIGLAAGVLAVGIGGGIGAAIGATLSVTAVLIQAIHPFLAAAVAGANTPAAIASVAGAAAGGVGAASIGAMVAIVIFAIVISVIQGLTVAAEAAIPAKLDDALARAQLGVDLRALAGNKEGRAEIYATFLLETLPDFSSSAATLAPIPAPSDSDRKFSIVDPAGVRTSSATIEYQCWNPKSCADGLEHSARLTGGWFVDQGDASGTQALTLNIDYINWAGEGWTASRIGPQDFLHTRTGDDGAEPFVSDKIQYLDWDGAHMLAQIAGPPPIPNAPTPSSTLNQGVFTLTWNAVSDPNGDDVTYSLMRCNAAGVIIIGLCDGPVIASGITEASYAFTSEEPEQHGRWIYRVAATDGEDSYGYSANSATVLADRQPPTISLVSRTPANSFGWNNTDVALTWSCVDGDSIIVNSSDSGAVDPEVSQTVTAEGAGQSATGECRDHAGNTAVDTQTDINIDKTPPVADHGGPYTAAEGSWILLDGSGSSDETSGVLSLNWATAGDDVFGTPSPALFGRPDGPSTYTVKLQVTDKAGNVSVAETTVTVTNVAPTIDDIQTNSPVPQGQRATITVSASDPGGDYDPLTYTFDCDGDTVYETAGNGNSGVCVLDPSAATTTIHVLVDDGDGGQTVGSVDVSQQARICANRSTGQISASQAHGNCPAGSQALTLPGPRPVTFCLNPYTGALTWSPQGTCGSGYRAHIVPDNGPLYYCQAIYTGKLRVIHGSASCTVNERWGVIPG